MFCIESFLEANGKKENFSPPLVDHHSRISLLPARALQNFLFCPEFLNC